MENDSLLDVNSFKNHRPDRELKTPPDGTIAYRDHSKGKKR